MKRKLPWLAALLIIAAVAAWLEPTCVVRGWLRGEAFYQGRPTSYWSRELSRWDQDPFIVWDGWIDVNSHGRSPSFLERAAARLGIEMDRPTRVPLHDDDPTAAPVLRELLDDPTELVRTHARRGLRRIEFNERSRSLQP